MRPRKTKTLPPEVESAINVSASSINAGQTVIFCGAGVSRDSGFPVVEEFVPYVLLTLCVSSEEIPAIEASLKAIADAQQRQDRLKQIIAKKMEVSPEVVGKIINSLPFEAFMETLRENSKIDELFTIYDAEAYEPHVEPNSNHVILARLAATGKVRTIVTTNFDQLIEKALGQEGRLAGRDYDVVYREEDFERIDWAHDRCRLIKIHGSVDDKQSMAITMTQVAKQELSAARAGIIRHVFSQGGHQQVLTLGYSCSDVFDLSPQIVALKDNLKKVSVVEHVGGPKIENIRNKEDKNPFKAFDNSTRLFLNTSDLVEALWKATLKEPYQYYKALKTSPDWKAKVQAWCANSVHEQSEAIKDAILGRIFNAICEWRAARGRDERVCAYAKEHANSGLEGHAMLNMGNACMHLGEYPKAIGLYEQALEIAQRIEEVQGEGSTLASMGTACMHLGDYPKAIGLYQQALEIFRRIGDAWGGGDALANMGNAYLELGDYPKAIELYEQAQEIAHPIGNVRGSTLGNMGLAYAHLGEYPKAIELYEQRLEIARRVGDALAEGHALGNMGNAYDDLGEHRKAIELYEQRLEIAQRIEDVGGEASTLGNMGLAYAHLGEYPKAIGLYQQALEIFRRLRDVRGEGRCLGNIGNAYASMGDKEKAAQAFAQSNAIFAKLGLSHMGRTID